VTVLEKLLPARLASPADAEPTIPDMNVAVIDVGSYTVRLLVGRLDKDGLEPLREARAAVGLGAEIEREGYISDSKLDETAHRVRAYSRSARKLGAETIQVIVTAPGRQSANAGELLSTLRDAAGVEAQILSSLEEGRLAFAGAVAGSAVDAESLAVIDIGGGSTEIVVGTRSEGPAWVRSFDVGALRLTSRMPDKDPPSRSWLKAAAADVDGILEGFSPPLPQAALATGGTARALRKLVGPDLGPDELGAGLAILQKRSSGRIARTFGIDRERARTLPAGAIILAAVQQRLGVSVRVASSGLREGAALALLEESAAA
jgi:exopolyphosphatase / guanosine-5'-triphosphate,3'-diphosphate pyrophosphatase